MIHIDLFSGIGGFALAADWTWGKENIEHVFCEIEPFAQKVLKKHWPGSPINSDIMEFNYDGPNPFILTGGFPCQPFSVAGKQRGAEDDRALWPEMLRIISETRPHWIIGENVSGFINMELDNCISDLESEGYGVQPMAIPAGAIGADHYRERVWILANSDSDGLQRRIVQQLLEETPPRPPEILGHPRIKQRDLLSTPLFCRAADGIPDRMDRLKGLGNAIVPQVAQAIMQCIKEIETK